MIVSFKPVYQPSGAFNCVQATYENGTVVAFDSAEKLWAALGAKNGEAIPAELIEQSSAVEDITAKNEAIDTLKRFVNSTPDRSLNDAALRAVCILIHQRLQPLGEIKPVQAAPKKTMPDNTIGG